MIKVRQHQLFINGCWQKGDSGELITSINPANLEKLGDVPRGTKEDIDRAVQAAKAAFYEHDWKHKHVERGRVLRRIGELILKHKQELAMLEMLDTGKPLNVAEKDIELGARYFEYYAGVVDKVLGETIPLGENIVDFTRREPIGVTAHIVPWNAPFQIACRSVAPALAVGNTAVIKPAEDTPLSTLKLAEICEQVDLPNGVLNIVTGYGEEAGAALASHPDVGHITFTGSVSTGIAVMKMAAENVTPVTLELGGKSPNIVFEDAHLDHAAHVVVQSITFCSGQVCIAGSRLLVERSIAPQFIERIKKRMKALTIGPGEANPDLGPLVSRSQLERVEAYVQYAQQTGASVVAGGKRCLDLRPGFFYEPTIIKGIGPDHKLAQEEIFGPVLVVIPFDSIEEALAIANGTPYGLAAAIWTSDINKAHWLADRIEAGQIFINNYGVGPGVEVPFGGYKRSGIGREKSLEAIRHYTQLKNVTIKYDI